MSVDAGLDSRQVCNLRVRFPGRLRTRPSRRQTPGL